MNLQILEVYIESAIMLDNLTNPSNAELLQSIQKYFPEIEVSIEMLDNYYLPETQDKLAMLKAWNISY